MKRLSSLATWGSISILFVGYGNAFVDRQVLSLLVAPIRSDLNIGDTQFSLLHGLAFALFYASFGIPIGRWVDRGDRPVILAFGMVIWSAFTCLSAWSHNFAQLFLLRMGVGAGEATVVPVSYSLIAEYFPAEKRGLALGLFGSGVYFGLGGAMLVGGALVGFFEALGPVELPVGGTLRPWQVALLTVGAPGIALALLALLLPELRRGSRPTSDHEYRPSAQSAWRYYRAARTAISLHHLSVAFMAMALYALLAWAPEHFRRRFGFPPAESGAWIGITTIVSGTLGVILGGLVSDRLLRKEILSARPLTQMIASLVAIPSAVLFAFAHSRTAALLGFGGSVLCISTLTSVGAAGVQELMPSDMRGLGAAVYQLTVNLVALSIGPAAVAIFTDYMFADDQMLYESLGITVPVMLLAAAALAMFSLRPYSIAAQVARLAVDRSTSEPLDVEMFTERGRLAGQGKLLPGREAK